MRTTTVGFIRRSARAAIATAIAFLFAVSFPAFAGKLAPDLESLLQDAPPDDRIPAIVMMEEFPDQQALLEEVRVLNLAERRGRIVDRLKTLAETSQHRARAVLADSAGAVDDVRILWGINGVALRATPDVLDRIALLPEVRVVLHDPDLLPEEVMDGGSGPTSTAGDTSGPNPAATVAGEIVAMGAQRVWDELGYTGAGILVAVIDNGFDPDHPDLSDHYWTHPTEIPDNGVDDDGNGYVDDTWGWDFCQQDNSPTPLPVGAPFWMHGTQAAGQVAGDGTGDGTEAIVTGMAPDAEIMALSTRTCGASTWFEASDYAIANGARIISMSQSRKWTNQPDYEAYRRQVAIELAAGLIRANSTGNTGNELGTKPVPHNVSTPGDCPPPWHHPDQTVVGGVTSVIGAANIDWTTDGIASSSPYGPAAWEDIRANTDPSYPHDIPAEYRDYPYENGAQMGLLKPDLAAYGQSTTSTCPLESQQFYCSFGGTSSATPHIAGALALMLSANPQSTPEQLAEAILTTAEHRGDPGKNNRYGVGLVQAYEAVLAVQSPCQGPDADFTATPDPARVGDLVQFDSVASGGAGGPYSYRWDFDADGVTDSTEPDPEYTYRRPFARDVTLWITDAAACATAVRRPFIVTGPDLWYDGYVALNEVDGNGNGGIDPGETWELTVNLRNDGTALAAGVIADLAVDPSSQGSVTVLRSSSTFDNIDVGQVVPSDEAYRFRVEGDFSCGQWIRLSVFAASSDPANAFPEEAGVIRVLVGGTGPDTQLYFDGFETDVGWTIADSQGDGEWERGTPLGLGSGSADPTSAYEGSSVRGNDLTGQGLFPGNYENDIVAILRSDWFDITSAGGVKLQFQRWLNVAPGHTASVYVLAKGASSYAEVGSWTGTNEDLWEPTVIDISNVVDGYSRFLVDFRLYGSAGTTASGWNIDAFEVVGVPLESCEPYLPGLRYDSFIDLFEVDGNGNGSVDPGETWELTVNLRNDGTQAATAVSAALAVDPATTGSVFLLQDRSTYGSQIGIGEVAPSDTAYRFRVGDAFPCNGEIVFSVVDLASTVPAMVYRDQVAVIRIAAGSGAAVFYDDFETDAGWTIADSRGDGEWELGPPQGLGSGTPDPVNAYEGVSVRGNDLTGRGLFPGDYEYDIVAILRSDWFDITSVVGGVKLQFQRWLNVAPGHTASVWVLAEGASSWAEIGSWTDTAESAWTPTLLDISSVVDGFSRFRVDLRLYVLGSGPTASGWNIDAFEVHDHTCEPFDRTLPGETTGLTVDKGAVGDLVLSWNGDCGAASTYGVYRGDLRVGYDSIVPEAGACNVTGTSATIPLGSGNAEFFLVVPHKDGEEGSYGTDSAGTPRPPAAGGCYPQGAVDVCAP